MAVLVNGLGGAAGFGEGVLGRNDDLSTGFIDLSAVFQNGLQIGAQTYMGVYLNNNGSVTFGSSTSSFTPTTITGSSRPGIFGFWSDIDTLGGAVAPSPGGNSTGSNLVYYDIDAATNKVTFTWDDVGYYSSKTDKLNAFQIVLTDMSGVAGYSAGDFRITFRYESINWSGIETSGVAHAGWSTGDGVFYELPQSGNSSQILGLEATTFGGGAGLWELDVREGEVEGPSTRLLFEYNGSGSNVLTMAMLADASYQNNPDTAPDNIRYLKEIGWQHLTYQLGLSSDYFDTGGRFFSENGSAIVMRSADALAFAFAGTEGASDRADWPYMDDQFQLYSTLFAAIDAYLAANPEIKDVYVSGHSLGAAIAEMYMEAHPDTANVSFHATVFANPGGFHGLGGVFGSGDVGYDARIETFQNQSDIINSVYDGRNDGNPLTQICLGSASGLGVESGPGGKQYQIRSLTLNFTQHPLQAYIDVLRWLDSTGILETIRGINYSDNFLSRFKAIVVSFEDRGLVDLDGFDYGAGPDFLEGGALADLIVAGDGNDTLKGYLGSDFLFGGEGNDVLYGSAGVDTLRGGNGNDTYYLVDGDDIVADAGGVDTAQTLTSLNLGRADLAIIENVVTKALQTTNLVGNALANTMTGWVANDIIRGETGFDTIYGHDGSDLLYGGVGKDSIIGGYSSIRFGANDQIVLDNDRIFGDSGEDTLKGGYGNDIIYGGSENDLIYGGKLNDNLFGDSGLDILYGDDGADMIYAGSGADKVFAGSGKDTIYGGTENDVIRGGNSSDTLLGGAGADSMYGEGDCDTFKFLTIGEMRGGGRLDLIMDFDGVAGVWNGGDILDLRSIDASTVLSGNNAFLFLGTGAISSTNSAGEIRFRKVDATATVAAHTIVYIDTDKDSSAEASFAILGHHTLYAEDFLL